MPHTADSLVSQVPLGDALHVFISSGMRDLGPVRERIAAELRGRGVRTWLYEDTAGARPESVLETSCYGVEEADVYVGVFLQATGEGTQCEFRAAAQLGKPRFVYLHRVLAEQTDDPFLQLEVLDPSCGVTYAFVDGFEDLPERIAVDLNAWLIRRYRALTAMLAEGWQAPDSRRLHTEIRRLQAAYAARLPDGTPGDLLAQQLRDWFTAVGYRIDSETRGADGAFTWSITVPGRHGPEPIVVVGADGEAGLVELAQLRATAAKQLAREGWLVALRRVSQAAVDSANPGAGTIPLHCYTLDQFIDAEVDFTTYKSWLEREVESRGVLSRYVPLACLKDEYDPSGREPIGRSRYDARNGSLDGYVDRWLDDPSVSQLSLLGEFGSGKTWFALKYAWTCLQRYRSDAASGLRRRRFPLYVPLREYPRSGSIEALITDVLCRTYRVRLAGYSAFEQLNRMGRLLLILDGFDEMAGRIDTEQVLKHFWELARLLVPGSKVLLTSRTEHFPDAVRGRELLGGRVRTFKTPAEPTASPSFEVLEIQQLSPQQVRSVLDSSAPAEARERILSSDALASLARRPLMIDLILDALPSLDVERPISLARVYFYAVRRKMERDTGAGRTFTSPADKLYFMCEVSCDMLRTNKLSLHHREIPGLLRALFGQRVAGSAMLDQWQHDMLGQSLLIRSANGEYRPAHRSILEFFAAYRTAAQLGVLAGEYLSLALERPDVDLRGVPQRYQWSEYFHPDLGGEQLAVTAPLLAFSMEDESVLRKSLCETPLARPIVDMFADMASRRSSHVTSDAAAGAPVTTATGSRRSDGEVLAFLWDILAKHRDEPPGTSEYFLGNLATLIRAMTPDMRYRDLSRIAFAGANLSGADLSGTRFSGSKLTSCDFSNTNLTHTDFSNAEFVDVSWGESGAVYSLDFSSNGRSAVTCIQGEGVTLWDVLNQAVVRTVRTAGTVYVCRWSADGKAIAAGTSHGDIILMDSELRAHERYTDSHLAKVEALSFGRKSDELFYATGGRVSFADAGTAVTRVVRDFSPVNCRALVYSTAAGALLIGRSDGVVEILPGPYFQDSTPLLRHTESVRALDVDASGMWMATGGKDATVVLTSLAERAEVSRVVLPGSIFSIAFHPALAQLAVSCHPNLVFVLAVPTLAQVWNIGPGHGENVRELRFSQDGRWLGTASYDGVMRLWSSPSYAAAGSFPPEGKQRRRIPCTGADLRGARGLTEEYRTFFRDRGAAL